MISIDVAFHLVLALTAAIVAGRLVGIVLGWLGQPSVIGEIIAGILLGPSLLGAVAPAAYAWLLPPAIVPALGAIAEIGVVIYMFLIGVELDAELLGSRSKTALASACGGLLLSAAMGAVLAVGIHASFAPPTVSIMPFSAFFAVAMAITAFPVLARILSDLRLIHTSLGIHALGAAAVADVAAWCALAGIVGFLRGEGGGGAAVAGLAIAFVLVVLAVGRWVGRVKTSWTDRLGIGPAVGLVLAMLAVSAWFTHAIGIHSVIGAFLAGAIVPADSRVAAVLTRDIGTRSVRFLLPAFFVLAGTRTDVGLIHGTAAWGVCLLIVVVATVGKVGGSFLASRATGLPSREAVALGVLMNTRGLMEIIVLNIGLELGVISPTLFAMMVLMALATTFATAPALRWLGYAAGQNRRA